MTDVVPFDPKSFWKAIGCRASGVAIVTAASGDNISGFLALSATHFAARPPTMTVSISSTTSAYADVVASGHFTINYLSTDGRGVFERFVARDAPKGAERFAGLDYANGATGAPVFGAITGAFECKVVEIIERFGTALVMGEILYFHQKTGQEPLVHFNGGLYE